MCPLPKKKSGEMCMHFRRNAMNEMIAHLNTLIPQLKYLGKWSNFDPILGKGQELWECLLQPGGDQDDSGPQCIHCPCPKDLGHELWGLYVIKHNSYFSQPSRRLL